MILHPSMSSVLLCMFLSINPGGAIVHQESREDVETMSFGHERKRHPLHLHKGALFWHMVRDVEKKHERKQEEIVPAQHSAPKNVALYQQHTLDIPSHDASSAHPPTSALQSQAKGLIEHQHGFRKSEMMTGLSPVILIILFAVCIAALMVMGSMLKSREGGDKSFHLFSDSESEHGSSDQSERSTDRELKTRMDRFEKRLSEHDSLHGKDSQTISPPGPSGSQPKPPRVSWMQKR